MRDLIEIALTQYGTKEIQGPVANNPEIIKYAGSIGQIWVKTDETAWCSAFISCSCMWATLPYSKELDARSWLKIGKNTDSPELGDIVVFWRSSPESWKGHVGIFIRQTKSWVYMLGGNQGNKVCIKAYNKSRVLGYRTL